MSVGPLQLLLVLLIVLVIFGSKKLGNIGSDLGKAIRGFKKGMDDDDKDKARAQNTQADDAPGASGDASSASAKSSAHDSEASSHKPSDH